MPTNLHLNATPFRYSEHNQEYSDWSKSQGPSMDTGDGHIYFANGAYSFIRGAGLRGMFESAPPSMIDPPTDSHQRCLVQIEYCELRSKFLTDRFDFVLQDVLDHAQLHKNCKSSVTPPNVEGAKTELTEIRKQMKLLKKLEADVQTEFSNTPLSITRRENNQARYRQDAEMGLAIIDLGKI